MLNVRPRAATKKLNIAIPDFTLVSGADPHGLGQRLA